MNEAIASSEYTKVEIEKLARGADPAVLAPNKKVKAGPEALFADAQSKLERAEAAQALPAHLHSEFADIAQLRASRDALQSRCIPDGDVEGQLQATLARGYVQLVEIEVSSLDASIATSVRSFYHLGSQEHKAQGSTSKAMQSHKKKLYRVRAKCVAHPSPSARA